MIHSYSQLEDFSEDIIAKAQNGLRLTNRALAEKADLDLSQIKSLKSGENDENAIRAVAKVLELGEGPLIDSANRSWLPQPKEVPGLNQFVSQFRTMTVNAYLLVDPTGKAILFDTGVDAFPILDHIAENSLTLSAICLTHGHPDHIAVLESILQAAGDCPVFAHPAEEIPNTQRITWDEPFVAGNFRLTPLSTPGHTPGGTSFHITNAPSPLAIVGDALFAGSVGGCASDYSRALQSIRENLLTLDSATTLCPGHGPLTSVGEELLHNPFFATE